MRNKHHRTSHKLGKRAFALCLALAVICSCLVPVFATGGIATMDGGFVMDEGFGVGGDDAGFAVDTQEVPASADDAATMEMPASSGDAATMDTPVVDTGDAASTSGPTITTKETEYGTVTEYDWGDSQTTWTGEDAIATPNDHMKEDDAAFGVLPIEYHFWLKQLDSFDFQMLAHEAEMAEMSETEYLALFGSSEQYPIWHMDTIASTDTISNYKFANPTAKDDPAGENHEFAYWYTVDENGVETEFDPYKTYGSETDTTVNVYAKWKDASGDVAQDTTKTEDTAKTESKTVEVSSKAVISETEDEVTITVKGLPENVKSLNVTAMGEGSMNTFYELYAAQNGTMAPLFGFKIAPKDADGNTVQPKGPVTVTISGLSDDIMISELAPFKVLHQVSDTDIETINASYNNGTLTFATDSFSPFVIASKNGYETSTLKWDDGGKLSANKYKLYCYVLIPGCDADSTEPNADKRWFGVGVGTISGTMIGDPNTIGLGTVTGATIEYPTDSNIKYTYNGVAAYPDITYNGVTYKYATPSQIDDEDHGKGWYTIEWFRTVIGNGANAGNNSYNNPVIQNRNGETSNEKGSYGSYAYHLDGTMIMNEVDKFTVQFKLKDAGETDFALVNPEVYTQRVEDGTSGKDIKVPTVKEPTVYPATKEIDGVKYHFVGWYDNEELTGEPVDFDSLIIKQKMTFWAKYEPEASSITVSKTVSGLLGDTSKDFQFNLCVKTTLNTKSVTYTKTKANGATETGTLYSLTNNVTTQMADDSYAYKYPFKLKHGESITFDNLPVGTYLVEEDDYTSDHYETKYTIGSGTESPGRTATVELKSTPQTVAFTNHATLDPDTGVLLDTLPYIVILAVVVGGGILLMLRKRRKNDD